MIRWRIRWSWALYACFWRSAVLYPGEGAGACHLVMWFIENIFWRRSCPYFLGCVQRSLLLLCLLSTLTRSAWEADLPLEHPTRPFRSLSFRVGFVFSVYVERQSWQASPSSAIFIMTYSAVCERAFQAISGSWLLSAGKVKEKISRSLWDGLFSSYSADIWAMGVSLYVLVLGRLPIQGSNLMDLMTSMKNYNAVPPMEGISDELKALLSSLLNPDVSLRPTLKEILVILFLQQVMIRRQTG